MLIINTKFGETNFNTMAKLLVKDKNGVEREMEQRSFDLAGSKRGFTVIRKIEAPKTEVQKIMDQKIAERAAQQAAKEPVKEELKEEVTKVNKGGRPKLNKTQDEA